MESDSELIRRVRERDGEAFQALLDRHGDALRLRLSQIVRDRTAVEDLFQELSLRLWTRAAQWDGRGAVGTWLLRIATNLALNHLRTLQRRRERPLEPWPDVMRGEVTVPDWMVDASALRPDSLAEAAERRQLLRELVDALPEPKRDVLRLAHEHEMNMQEIAERLGIPEGTVKSRLHHATRRLAREWQSRWEDST